MGTLYLIATPIGNLEDLSPRAARLLGSAAVIACEDTRRTAKLLAHAGLRTPLVSYHEHNEQERAAGMIARLQQGQDVAVVSDAGTPLISDPGLVLVRAALAAGITVCPVPGACAVEAALALSGFPAAPFYFAGFLPARAAARRGALAAWRRREETIVCFEAPHRLRAALQDMQAELGAERGLVAARELTKMHEEAVRGTIAEVSGHFARVEPRGEFTLVLAPVPAEARAIPGPAAELVAAWVAQGLDPRLAAKKVARQLGLPRAGVYREWQAGQGRAGGRASGAAPGEESR